ncbi:hypothetical protein NX801_12645 [Streptomyces sp. LP05-1]|uniref:Translation initiation factor IF-2 n=1 Tax=Streptomyces pyxinae TaxID=2970734 RepID=A0ABT2CIF8_9ACTN|nr:hypothetical protein [Streptomyces sp. LP05-1]MCS0636496.1 hypothetical protein [Streptomyces sp. LP05-1]
MSEEQQPKPPTPGQMLKQMEEAQATRRGAVAGRFAVVKTAETLNDTFSFFTGGGSVLGRTDFENAQLNVMLDFLESADPAELENAGKSLQDVTTALNTAARDLAGYVEAVHWEGEGAEEFRRYGSELVKYAYGLAGFATTVGSQMQVASTGLASVRNARPPRDNRFVQKKPEDFALPERIEANKEYQKALQVEQDRQEAINQMNRLASYYSVSETTLAAQEPPKPPKLLNVDVPPPIGGVRDSPTRVNESRRDNGGTHGGVAPVRHTRLSDSGGSGSHRPGHLGEVGRAPQLDTTTNIDSVTTPVAPAPGPVSAPPASPGTVPAANPQVSVPTGGLTPVGGTAPRTSGTQSVPRTYGVARVGLPGGTGGRGPLGRAVSRAEETGPVTGGRPSPAGRAGASGAGPFGRSGVPGGGGASPTAGRAGAAGQQPVNGRTSPIMGGKPQRAGSGAANGRRIPQGTVVGGQQGATGRAGQTPVTRSGGRGTSSPNGVVGTPRNGGQNDKSGQRPVSGRAGRREKPEERERNSSTRPDYLVEDEETWAAKQREAVPPVIDQTR